MLNRYFSTIVISLFIFCSCKKSSIPDFAEIQINDNWSFRKSGDTLWHAAVVPGDVISDLLRNQLIDDPFCDTIEKRVQWIESQDWEYRTKFDVPSDILDNDQVLLHFSGLDTYADVYLNDSLLLKADNMFRYWEVSCNGLLKERNNVLYIYFHSAVKTGLNKLKQLPYLLPANNEQAPENERTSIFTRKAPFQYGWDWGPRLVTCGIWRPVSIISWSKAHINDIYLRPETVSNKVAEYTALLDIEAIEAGTYTMRFTVDDRPIGQPFKTTLKSGFNQGKFIFQISNPELWWCNGMGAQKVYTLRANLYLGDKLISVKNQHFGVRRLELVQTPDSLGRSFYFRLNGIPVFMKGANYIPQDILTTRVTKEDYNRLIDNAVKANMNMLRVWGGAIYEDNKFYELCDQKGILVWQDFMFACSMQPGDNAHIENIRQEAIQNVKRLRNHPCMALWCGNNENLVAWNKWGWKNRYPKDIADKIWSDYEQLFYNILPGVVKEYDVQTPYWASSPSAFGNNLPDKNSGDEHEWDVWFNTAPFSKFSERPGRFVSEYGLQAFPVMRTIRAFTKEDDLNPRSPVLEFHQRCNMPWISQNMNGTEMIKDYIQMYYNEPSDFESFVYLSQITQAEGLKSAIEAHRSMRPRCMGSLYWQINDCWPAISWSTIDYFGRWKPAHYTVRRSFANLGIIPQRVGGEVKIFAVNDSVAEVKAEVKLRMMDFNGKTYWDIVKPVVLPSDSTHVLLSIGESKLCPEYLKFKTCLLMQLIKGSRIISENIMYFTDPKYLDLPVPDVSYEIKGSANRFELVLKTDKLAKNVVLDTREKEAVFSDNNLDLIPGRMITLDVNYPGTRVELSEDLKITSLVDSY